MIAGAILARLYHHSCFNTYSKKNELFAYQLKNPSDEMAVDLYKTYGNKLTHVKEISKKMYYKSVIDVNKSNSNRLWKVINEIIRQERKQTNNIPHEVIDANGHKQTDSVTVSNAFNQYFSEVGSRLASKIPPTSRSSTANIKSVPYSTFLESIITEEEVTCYIRSLNDHKSAGATDISIKCIKLYNVIISPILTVIFNRCMTEGIFSDDLKIAQITPIFKKRSKALCGNYRPISVLSLFSKILEKYLHKQIFAYLLKNKLIAPHQYGFREGYSTSLALATVHNEIISNIDDKKITCTIFLDLAKASDTVDHFILINKLRRYGIRGSPLELLKSYLSNRKQFTVVNNVRSSFCNVTCGIPQVSTLGPLLFLLYINDLPLATKFNVKLFADDTNLTMRSNSVDELQNNVNLELTNVINWMRNNRLSINFAKTEYMIVTKKKLIEHLKFEIKIDNHVISKKECIKYQGVLIDNNLDWKHHIKQVCKKISAGAWAIARLRNYVNTRTLKSVFYSLIHSHFLFSINTWGSASSCNLKPLKILQKHIVRLIAGSEYRAPSSPLFNQLQILPLEDIYTFEVAKHMNKFSTNQRSGLELINYCPISKIHSNETTKSVQDDYYIIRTNTKFARRSLSVYAPLIWSDVPNELKNTGINFSKFKKKCKKHLIFKYHT